MSLERVRPGDLISADFFNAVIDLVNDLQNRVETLESGAEQSGQVRITAFNPPPPPAGPGQNLGQVLQIFGDNFAWPSQGNTVTIQNFGVSSGGLVTITSFRPGSNPKMLEFLIPTTIAGIGAAGTEVTVRVRAGEESGQATYRLFPALPTTGSPPTMNPLRKLDGSFNLTVGQPAVITGTNLGATVAANQITFIVPIGGTEKRYPDPAGADPNQRTPITITSVNTERTRLEFIVPTISEANLNGIDVSVELKVGNFAPVERVVNVSTDV